MLFLNIDNILEQNLILTTKMIQKINENLKLRFWRNKFLYTTLKKKIEMSVIVVLS